MHGIKINRRVAPWRSWLAARLDPAMADDAFQMRSLRLGGNVNFKLQRRIHCQRIRLRELERMLLVQDRQRHTFSNHWKDLAMKYWRESARAKAGS